MALYDSADLLQRFRDYSDRPADDQDLTATKIYRYLTDAQQMVYGEIISRFPRLLMSAPVLMTSADNGTTYTVGTDSEGSAIYPFGHAEVYAKLPNGRELFGSTFAAHDGDVVFEGSKIRIPAGETEVFTAGPYIRYVPLPLQIDASTEPTLEPKQIRPLILYLGLVNWANSGGHRDPRPFQEMYDQAWNSALLLLTTQYRQAAQAALAGVTWWRWWMANGGLSMHSMHRSDA